MAEPCNKVWVESKKGIELYVTQYLFMFIVAYFWLNQPDLNYAHEKPEGEEQPPRAPPGMLEDPVDKR